ncbi:uncharacterized protein ISCGN_013470 [Ixodes scapularis]
MAKLWVLSHFKEFQQLCLCASQQAQYVWYCGFQAVGATVCVRNEFSMLTKQEPAVAWHLPLLELVSEPGKLPHEGVVHRPGIPWVDAHYPAVGVTHLKVCSAHFVAGEKTDENIVPQLSLGYARKVVVGRRRLVRDASCEPLTTKRKKLSSGAGCGISSDSTAEHMIALASTSALAAPEHSSTSSTEEVECIIALASISEPATFEHSSTDSSQEVEQIISLASTSGPAVPEHSSTDYMQEVEQIVESDLASTSWESTPEHTATDHGSQIRSDVCRQGVQREDTCHRDHAYSKPKAPAATPALHSGYSLEDRDIFFYTGLHADVFKELVKVVPQFATTNFMMPVEQQLLLTLMKLRLGLIYGDLSRRFAVSVSTVGNIFRAMLATLGQVLRNVVVWLSRDTIFRNIPRSFEENGFAGTTCILDCTEVFLQRPKKLLARAQTYSSYKGHNTVKFLVAIAPHGSVMFVSKVYGGRASDKHIVRDSGIISHFERGDHVMADRGFSLDPEMEAKGVALNTPAFTRGKAQLSEQEVTETRRIASVRIHVERAINRIKSYRILKQALPIQHRKVASDIVFVCAGLCNLKGPLIKK